MEKATVLAEDNVSSIDRMLFAQLGRFTLGLSPAALILADQRGIDDCATCANMRPSII
jgi:hypothetical protein